MFKLQFKHAEGMSVHSETQIAAIHIARADCRHPHRPRYLPTLYPAAENDEMPASALSLNGLHLYRT